MFVEQNCGIDVDGRPILRWIAVYDMAKPEIAETPKPKKPLPIDCTSPDGGRAIYHVRMGRMMGVRGG